MVNIRSENNTAPLVMG